MVVVIMAALVVLKAASEWYAGYWDWGGRAVLGPRLRQPPPMAHRRELREKSGVVPSRGGFGAVRARTQSGANGELRPQ